MKLTKYQRDGLIPAFTLIVFWVATIGVGFPV